MARFHFPAFLSVMCDHMMNFYPDSFVLFHLQAVCNGDVAKVNPGNHVLKMEKPPPASSLNDQVEEDMT